MLVLFQLLLISILNLAIPNVSYSPLIPLIIRGKYYWESLAEEDLPVDTARYEKKRKTATIMEEPGDGLHEEQRHGIGYGGE